MDTDSEVNVVTPGGADLTNPPISGRTFTTTRRVSVDDATPDGRMELDAIARFLQDTGNDDTDDAGMAELGMAWVARRATIEVLQAARARELLTMTTWCSGTGRSWAERRTSLRGEHGGHIEAVAVWVHIDPETGRPTRWGDGFANTYLEATSGRRIDAKLRHGKAVPDEASEPWLFRQTDMDAFGHVNNAAYLAIAEEYLDIDGDIAGDVNSDGHQRIEIEWRGPSVAGEELRIHRSGHQLWVTAVDTSDLRVTITG